MLHSTQSKENGWSLPGGNYSVEQMDLDCSAPFQLLWKRSEITDKCKLMMLQNSTDFNSVYSSLRRFFLPLINVCFFLEVGLILHFFLWPFSPHTKKSGDIFKMAFVQIVAAPLPTVPTPQLWVMGFIALSTFFLKMWHVEPVLLQYKLLWGRTKENRLSGEAV